MRLAVRDPDSWDPARARSYLAEWQHDYYTEHVDHIRALTREWRARHPRPKKPRRTPEEQRERTRANHREYYRTNERYRERTLTGAAKRYRAMKGRWSEFGEYLSGLLEQYDGMKREFAAQVGIDPSLVTHYAKGNRKPTERTLQNMARLFDVSYESLASKLSAPARGTR